METEESIQSFEIILPFFTEPLLLAYLGYYIIKLSKKYFQILEPVHLLEINILFDGWLLIVMKFLSQFQYLFDDWSPFCTLSHLIDNALRISIHMDISASEIHRFLFIYLGNEYHEKVTKNRSFISVGLIKVLSFFITVIGSIFDRGLFKCYQRKFHLCANIRRNNFYWSAIPMIFRKGFMFMRKEKFVKPKYFI